MMKTNLLEIQAIKSAEVELKKQQLIAQNKASANVILASILLAVQKQKDSEVYVITTNRNIL